MKQASRMMLGLCVIVVLCALATGAHGATFYVDPVNGSMSGDGSQNDPWSTLQEVFSNNKIESQMPASYPYDGELTTRNSGAPVKAGDTIVLLSGDHGYVSLQGWFNTSMITIQAASGATPVLEYWALYGGMNWKLKGLTISAEPYGTPSTGTLVWNGNHSWHGPVSYITVEDCEVYTVDDASSWDATDWTSTAATGISMTCDNAIVRNNTIRNVNFGINCTGDDMLAEYNTIEHISGDGMRGGGDRITFQYNTIRYFYEVDGNHDDAIQFYRGGGLTHYDIIIRGNFIDGIPRSGVSLSTNPQGIGCFDGPYEDWLIENNVVLVSHYHGISVYDSTNCKIINNTVLDTTQTYASWIMLAGTTVSGVARNNMSTSLPSGSGITTSNNIDLDTVTWSDMFVDYQNYNVHLKTGSSAIDAGTSTDAPSVDIEENSRPSGNGYDIGAYEYDSGTSNVAPTADAGSDQTVTDNDDSGAENVTLDGSGSSDSDGTITSYVWKESTTQIATGSGPTVSFAVGGHTVVLTVTDDDSATDTDSVTITVNEAPNQAPSADAGSDQTIAMPTLQVSLDGTVSDDGKPDPPAAVTVTWSKVSGPGTVTFGNANAVDTTAAVDAIGVYVLRLTANDGALSDSDDVTITVNHAAGATTSSSTWQTIGLGQTLTGAFTVEFDAVPNAATMDGVTGICLGTASTWNDLACIVRFNPSGALDVRDGGSYTADTTMTYSAGSIFHVRMEIDIATHTYSVYVTPYGGSETLLADTYDFRTQQASVASLNSWAIEAESSSHTVSGLTVSTPNQAPTADAGTDQTVTDTDGGGDQSVTLDGSGSSDSDGTIESYVWKEGATQIATGSGPSVSMDIGVHTIDLTVTDDDDDTDSDSVEITVVSRTLTSSTDPYTWPASDLPAQTGTFTCEFDAVPNDDGIDGVTGLAYGPADHWNELACIVRFNTSGNIDVRDGSGYDADATLAYTADTTYHVRMVVDVSNHEYSVYVTPDGQSEVTLATDYAFRTEQQSITSIDDWTLNAASSVDTHTVSNLTLTD